MNRVRIATFQLLAAFLILGSCLAAKTRAQTPSPSPSPAKQEEGDPFAPEPPPTTLPPGATGANTADPRVSLTPGMYDAGETSMGIKHLMLVKKPDAFQLGTTDPDSEKVGQTLGL